MIDFTHLLIDGEYPERARILADLDVELAGVRPPSATHSIYEELWHLTKWQSIVLSRDPERRRAWIEGERYPVSLRPSGARELRDLAAEFLEGLQRAVTMTRDAQTAEDEALRAALISLAVHNAYHLGKIVALRQALHGWPVP